MGYQRRVHGELLVNYTTHYINMYDIFGGRLNLQQTILKTDPVRHDNLLFKLHHQANFLIVLFGVVFVVGMNYFNENSIACFGTGTDVTVYHRQFCWLHGSGHIPKTLADANNIKCQPDQTKNSEPNERHTQYYLWIPFVLSLLLAVIKAPRFIWKKICERGQMNGVVGDGTVSAEEMCNRFNKLRKKNRTGFYYYAYFFCEMLNILCLITCFFSVDGLLGKNFQEYGKNVYYYDSGNKTAVDPKCNLFPTMVSCNVVYGGIDRNADTDNILCLLSNNLFNQYYFLVLWFWWVTLMILSAGGFVYRLAQFVSTDFSRIVFISKISHYGFTLRGLTGFGQAEYFFLGRICENLKGSQIEELIEEFRRGDGQDEEKSKMLD